MAPSSFSRILMAARQRDSDICKLPCLTSDDFRSTTHPSLKVPLYSFRLSSIAFCLGMALLFQSFCGCCGEILFHRRDLKDQKDQRQQNHGFRVETFSDAVKYLNKYGYLNCTSKSGRQKPLNYTLRRASPVIRTSTRPLACTETEFQNAFENLQHNFKLQTTGRLDDQTKRTMNQGRCGNSDIAEEERDQISLPEMSNRMRREFELLNSVQSTGDARSSLKNNGGKQWKRRQTLEPEESLTTDAVETRKKMLSTIRKRLDNRRQERLSSRSGQAMAKHLSIAQIALRIRQRRSLTTNDTGQNISGDGAKSKIVVENNQPVLWRLSDSAKSTRIPENKQKSILQLSVRMWSEVIPLTFAENEEGDIRNVHIIFSFGRGRHLNCDRLFDGSGGELAHSSDAGEVHFDDDENYRENDVTAINFLKVALHEVGHTLGLPHNDRRQSIMYPIYVSPSEDEDVELLREDRDAIQKIYGVCKGTFDAVFDWLRKVYEPELKYIYNTYFFRGSKYWLYENRQNRTRYGDPLSIESYWSRVPGNLDGIAQVNLYVEDEFTIQTFFFKGDFYYKYDDANLRVMDGYPRLIAEDFGAGPGFNESIPNDIDSVLFDSTITDTPTLYFFKGDWVWLYDAQEIGRNACCISKHRFTELFPILDGDDDPDPLTGDVSNVYYSYHFRTTYFFKDESVYSLVINIRNSSVQSHQHGLQKMSPWYQTWRDICNVD